MPPMNEELVVVVVEVEEDAAGLAMQGLDFVELAAATTEEPLDADATADMTLEPDEDEPEDEPELEPELEPEEDPEEDPEDDPEAELELVEDEEEDESPTMNLVQSS